MNNETEKTCAMKNNVHIANCRTTAMPTKVKCRVQRLFTLNSGKCIWPKYPHVNSSIYSGTI